MSLLVYTGKCRFPQNPEECVRSSGARVTVACVLPKADAEKRNPGSLEEQCSVSALVITFLILQTWILPHDQKEMFCHLFVLSAVLFLNRFSEVNKCLHAPISSNKH